MLANNLIELNENTVSERDSIWWIVLIDVNFRDPSPEWWPNSGEPETLSSALKHAAEVRRSGWIAVIEPYEKGKIYDDAKYD